MFKFVEIQVDIFKLEPLL